jgi:hypothetical protein
MTTARGIKYNAKIAPLLSSQTEIYDLFTLQRFIKEINIVFTRIPYWLFTTIWVKYT